MGESWERGIETPLAEDRHQWGCVECSVTKRLVFALKPSGHYIYRQV
jgi:hypothetical protein